MTFAPTSIPWLLAHELRITWRTWFGRRKAKRFGVPPWIVAAVLLLALSALGVPAALALRGEAIIASAFVVVAIDLVLLLVFTLMVSQTLVAAVDAFYDRGDLDLLLASPLSPTRLLVVRALAIAVNPALLFGAIVTPFVLPAAVLGHPELLAIFVVLGALSLLATGLGLAIAMGLFALIGPRRTRNVAQVLAAVMGAGFVIVAQLPNLGGRDDREGFWNDWLVRILGDEPLPPVLTFPAEAVLGGPLPLAVVAIVAVAVFAATALRVGRRFASDAASAYGAATPRPRRVGRTRAPAFGAGAFRATMVKEARLLRRDPGLIAQILLRVFYVVPLTFFIVQSGEDIGAAAPLAAGAIALLAGQLAGSIAWIVLSAEDAPGLLAASPVPIGRFWTAKLAMTLIPPAILVIPTALALTVFAPLAGLLALAGGAASAASAGLINLWLQKPARRAEFRRSWSATFSASILELAVSACWAAATGMAVAGLLSALIPFGIALAILALAYRPERAIRERLIEGAG